MAEIKGGDKLAKALAEIAANLGDPGTLRVGFLEGGTAPNGQSMPLRAALNEFGHTNANGSVVPPRPFMRNTVKAKSGEWPDAIALQLKATHYDTKVTLERVGEAIKGQIQDTILNFISPPNAPSTIARKGFDAPLREHGDMLNAVAAEVKT
jgi:hypothetical protein